jgi:hypothetical protein
LKAALDLAGRNSNISIPNGPVEVWKNHIEMR